MAIKKKMVTYEEVDVERDELMTISEASQELEMSVPGVVAAINRGALTEYIDESQRFHGKRLVSRQEVARY
jgi:hypothetical protein